MCCLHRFRLTTQLAKHIYSIFKSRPTLFCNCCFVGNSDYAERPTLTHTITTDAGSQRREPINGMAILGQELFVSHENKSVIEVYDSETFQFVRHWVLEGMSHLLDFASCK